jgi:alpha-glucosidase
LWYDFFEGDHTKSSGQNLSGYPLYRDGLFRLPVFAKGGAIVPRYAGHLNQHGLGTGRVEPVAKTMLLDVFANDKPDSTQFDMSEDDGYSRQVDKGAVRVTRIEQKTSDFVTSVSIHGAVGSYDGAIDDRAWTVRIWSPGWQVAEVLVERDRLEQCSSQAALGKTPCYRTLSDAAVIIELPLGDVRRNQTISVRWSVGSARKASVNFVCDEGRDSPRGYGMFVSGDHPALGSWDPNKAVPLKPSEYARGVWTKVIKGLSPGTKLEWKCLRKLPGGGDSNLDWQRGSNNQFDISSDGGFSGMARVRWQDLQ